MRVSIFTMKHALASAFLAIAGSAYADPVVLSGSFTNPGGSNAGAPAGAGWYFNNVRNSGVVAVDTSHARSGNGSVSFSGPANAKADIEFLPNAVPIAGNYSSGGSLGALSALSSMSYDWYRDSASAATAGLHPSLRVLIDTDGNLLTPGDRGGLVFERVYNGPAAADDAWISELISDSTFMWNFGTLLGFGANINASPYAYDATLAEWKAFFPNASIIGFSSGIGGGWGDFSGAVDNISWTIDGVTTSANFETERTAAVPEPGTVALLGLGLLGAGAARWRRGRCH
ncbi:MAG: hypothetical protein JWR40_2680 [Massilia sp.]|jgi:hypothetical protein|nr:hypothetical protein [Massilia sp.]MDB5951504.1 hypothetical protein [Massilia sp.]